MFPACSFTQQHICVSLLSMARRHATVAYSPGQLLKISTLVIHETQIPHKHSNCEPWQGVSSALTRLYQGALIGARCSSPSRLSSFFLIARERRSRSYCSSSLTSHGIIYRIHPHEAPPYICNICVTCARVFIVILPLTFLRAVSRSAGSVGDLFAEVRAGLRWRRERAS